MPTNKKLKSRNVDEIDKKILMILQEEGRLQLTQIAKKVNLSIDSVHKRMKEMQRKEIFFPTVFVDPRKVGFPIIMDIKIKLKNIEKKDKDNFIEFLVNHKRVTSLFSVMGEFDFTCVIIAKNTFELEETSMNIRQVYKEIIADWRSYIVLKTHKIEYYDLT